MMFSSTRRCITWVPPNWFDCVCIPLSLWKSSSNTRHPWILHSHTQTSAAFHSTCSACVRRASSHLPSHPQRSQRGGWPTWRQHAGKSQWPQPWLWDFRKVAQQGAEQWDAGLSVAHNHYCRLILNEFNSYVFLLPHHIFKIIDLRSKETLSDAVW